MSCLADGTLFVLPKGADRTLMASFLTLSDVMGTGHHAARVAGVGPGKMVAVVGDGAVGRVGVPQDEKIPASRQAFYNNVIVGGGPAPARAYIGELLPDVLRGRIQPGRVFDLVVGIEEASEGYRAMNERKAIKVLIEM